MTTLFISDLHLCKSRPEITELFVTFLQLQQEGDTLYILGDLFEVWIGDDAIDATVAPVIEALNQLSDRSIKCHVMHGNRDFLLGQGFEAASGCQLIDEPTTISLDGKATLLMHGDTLCTDDLEYQAFRKQIRDPAFTTEFLSHPIEKRIAIASQFREESRSRSREKSAEIMDVNQSAVEQTMQAHNVRHLIHGHTHRPAQHHFELDGEQHQRTVLGDWYHQGSVLRYANGEFTLEILPL